MGMVLATSDGKVEWLGANVLLVQPATDVDDSAVLGVGAAFWRRCAGTRDSAVPSSWDWALTWAMRPGRYGRRVS